MSAQDLLINRNLLDAAKQLSSAHKDPKAPSRGPASFEELINGFRVNFTQKCLADHEETETRVLSAIDKLKAMKADALESQRGTEGLLHALQILKLSSENSLSNIDQNSKLLRDSLNVIQQKKAKINESDAKLEKAVDFTAAGVIMDETQGILNEPPEEIKEIEDLLQKSEREREDIIKESLNTKIRLENVSMELGRSEDDCFVNVTVNVLRSLCGPLRSDAHREIFAVKTVDGKQRVARVKIGSKNQVSLNHLEEGDVPPKSYVIQLEYLMKMSTQRAFLDLGEDRTHLGRIIIKVNDGGNLALNFLHLCAGDLGTSYANSQVLDVDSKDEDGESIGMGHYRMLLSGVDFKEETKRDIKTLWKAGDVRVHVPNNEDNTPLFYIITKDKLENQTIGHFGTVEEGLGVLQGAILQYPDIQKIKIVECGLILSL